MQKEIILQKLKDQGCRITKQRRMLLDIILEEDCSCCKEIYYKASKLDRNIGAATVYRMINTLESIGAISRKNMYKIACDEGCENGCEKENACTVELNDNTVYHLSAGNWRSVIQAGLRECGYLHDQKIKSVVVQSCECDA
ncbi:MAG: transcriptional repressor [Lachnospiraceae bacterium]|nr:transcriptional repressor [Lachnospiraceae bacterium]